MPVTRQCFRTLIVTAWIFYAVSFILIIASMCTDTWLIQPSSRQQKGIFPCCPAFVCNGAYEVTANSFDAFLGVFMLGFIVAITGGIASVVFTFKNKQLQCLKCFYFAAAVIGSGGVLLMAAAVIFDTTVPSSMNSVGKRNCVYFQDDIEVGGSFIVFTIGSVGIFLSSLPLYAAIPRVRRPVLSGDIVEEAARTEMTSAIAESSQHASPNNAHNGSSEISQAAQSQSSRFTNIRVDDIQLRQMRHLGASNGSESRRPDSDFWDVPRVTPSAPDLDSISETSARIFSISEQLNLEESISNQTQMKQWNFSHSTSHTGERENSEMSESNSSGIEQEMRHSSLEQPATNYYISEQSEAEYSTIEEMITDYAASTQSGSQYNNISNVKPQAASDSQISTSISDDYIIYEQPDTAQHNSYERKETTDTLFQKPETEHSIPDLRTMDSTVSNFRKEDNNVVGQSGENRISEHTEVEYATVDDTLSNSVASNHSESFYNNLEHPSSTADNLIYEDTELAKT